MTVKKMVHAIPAASSSTIIVSSPFVMGCPPRLSVAAGGVAVNFITWYALISCYTINGGARRCHSGMGGADTPTDKETRQ